VWIVLLSCMIYCDVGDKDEDEHENGGSDRGVFCIVLDLWLLGGFSVHTHFGVHRPDGCVRCRLLLSYIFWC
jgi:hypothetical protein